ncbi:MAG: hypothetical protein H0W06_11180 [Chloroflexia bacterium]|nr:hypothetical protein [Chloroflexia bacterium]
MTGMGGRIDKLSDHFRGAGCGTCRGWEHSRVYFAIDPRAEPDITPRPPRCPKCGRRILKLTDVIIERDPGEDAGIAGE